MVQKKKSTTMPSDTSLRKTQQYAILSKAIALVAKSGATRSETSRLLSLAIKRTAFPPKKSSAWLSGNIRIINVILTVLQSWHRHRELLDDLAKPLPIRLLGRAPSVESIIQKEHAKSEAAILARQIYKLGFIRRAGKNKYLPVHEFADIPGTHPLYLIRANYLTAKLFDTIEHNMFATNDGERIVERLTHVDNLPREKLAAFLDFSRQQSKAITDVTNNWLESNKQVVSPSKRKSPSVEAGIHIFAFMGKPTK